MKLKIGRNTNRCLITVDVDKSDLFEVMKGLLNEGLVEIRGIEDAPTLRLEELVAVRQLATQSDGPARIPFHDRPTD